jgi:rhodanese-related sulfurtransferase
MPTPVDTKQVEELVGAGAQLVDVLPAETYLQEHLPSSTNLPMAQIGSARDKLDPRRPVIVYCYDYQCDLSARAAARLEQLGFDEVYDYVASKVAWLADGLPSEGLVDDARRAIARVHRDVPTVPSDATLSDVAKVIDEWELAVVLDADHVVLGVVRAEAAETAPELPVTTAMQPAPPTVRPSIPLRDLVSTMDKNGEAHLLVTTLSGRLIGLVRRDELDELDED